MRRLLAGLDRLLAASRPGWIGWAQLALVVLGVHLAADRLDDLLLDGLQSTGLAGPDGALQAATWGALVIELAVDLRAATALALTPQPGARAMPRRVRSVEAIVLPLFWAVAALAGAWVVAMAVEDALAPLVPPAARWTGLAVGLLAAWRLGWTGLQRAEAGALDAKRWTSGLVTAPLLLAVTAVLLGSGLPLGGVLR